MGRLQWKGRRVARRTRRLLSLRRRCRAARAAARLPCTLWATCFTCCWRVRLPVPPPCTRPKHAAPAPRSASLRNTRARTIPSRRVGASRPAHARATLRATPPTTRHTTARAAGSPRANGAAPKESSSRRQPSRGLEHISVDAEIAVAGLTRADPAMRMSAAAFLRCDWIQRG
eukprot:6407983-Prymnesium_polylepis.1